MKKRFAVWLLALTLFAGLLLPQLFSAEAYTVPSYGPSAMTLTEARQSGKLINIAHMQDWRNYNANSLLAINSCINMGVEMVEVDIQITNDSAPIAVLAHDDPIWKSNNTRNGSISDHTWSQLKTLTDYQFRRPVVNPSRNNYNWDNTYTINQVEATMLNGLSLYKSTVGTAVKGNKLPLTRLDTAMELINKRCLVSFDKLSSAERFAACYRACRETGALEYVLFKVGKSASEILTWCDAAVIDWNAQHPNDPITRQTVKETAHFGLCKGIGNTAQADYNFIAAYETNGLIMDMIEVWFTAANEERAIDGYERYCRENNVIL